MSNCQCNNVSKMTKPSISTGCFTYQGKEYELNKHKDGRNFIIMDGKQIFLAEMESNIEVEISSNAG